MVNMINVAYVQWAKFKEFKGLKWLNVIKDEKGLGTVEIVIITAVLVGLALLFRVQIIEFLNSILSRTFDRADSIFD